MIPEEWKVKFWNKGYTAFFSGISFEANSAKNSILRIEWENGWLQTQEDSEMNYELSII
jgi:ribosome modulation factor